MQCKGTLRRSDMKVDWCNCRCYNLNLIYVFYQSTQCMINGIHYLRIRHDIGFKSNRLGSSYGHYYRWYYYSQSRLSVNIISLSYSRRDLNLTIKPRPQLITVLIITPQETYFAPAGLSLCFRPIPRSITHAKF